MIYKCASTLLTKYVNSSEYNNSEIDKHIYVKRYNISNFIIENINLTMLFGLINCIVWGIGMKVWY